MAVLLKYENGKMIPVHVNSIAEYNSVKSKPKKVKASTGIINLLVMISLIVTAIVLVY